MKLTKSDLTYIESLFLEVPHSTIGDNLVKHWKTITALILENQEFWGNCRKTFEDLRYENKPLYLMTGDDTLKIMKEWHEKAEKFDEELKQFLKTEDHNEELLEENKQLKEKLKFYLEPFELRPTYQELEKKLSEIEKEIDKFKEYRPEIFIKDEMDKLKKILKS